MNNKKYIFLVLFLTVISGILYLGAMYVLDPLQIFHKTSTRKDGNLIAELRFQAAGIINNYQFDSIILGSSMVANSYPSEATNIFGSRFVNLSPDGSSLFERSLILNYALKKHKLKYVIMTLNGFIKPGEDRQDFPSSNFDFLYDDNRFNDLKIYSNFKYAKYAICSLTSLYTHISSCKNEFKSLDNVTAWWPIQEYRRRFGGIDKWFEAKNNVQIKAAFKKIVHSANCIKNGCGDVHKSFMYEFAAESFEEYVLKFAKENPNTQFDLFFPPYSRLQYAMWAQGIPAEYDLYLNAIRFIVHQAGLLSNLHIYGFDDMIFLDDIANYKDPKHHHQKFNSKILYWIKNGEHELSDKMLGKYLEKIRFKAEHYDVISIGDKIEKYLNGG